MRFPKISESQASRQGEYFCYHDLAVLLGTIDLQARCSIAELLRTQDLDMLRIFALGRAQSCASSLLVRASERSGPRTLRVP